MIQFSKEKLCLVLVLQDISASLEGDASVNYDVVNAHAAKTFKKNKRKAVVKKVSLLKDKICDVTCSSSCIVAARGRPSLTLAIMVKRIILKGLIQRKIKAQTLTD